MADDANGDAKAPAAGGAAPQAGTPDAKSPSPADTGKPEGGDPAWLDTKKKLDKEAIQLRKERDALAQKLKEREDADLSETERLKKQVKEFEDRERTWAAERRERDARDETIAAASDEKVGARNPRAVYKLVKDDLEFDEKTGRVTNLDSLLKKAKAEYPELFGRAAGSADGGSGSRGKAAGVDMNAWLRGGRGA